MVSCSQFAQATAVILRAGLVSWLIRFLNRPAIQWLDWPIVVGIDFLRTAVSYFQQRLLLFYRELVRVSVPLRATYRPGPRIVVLYAEAGSGRAILMNDSLGKHEGQRVLWT